jgi:hypothetical protein
MFLSKTRRASRAVSVTVLLASLLAGCSDLYFDRRETVLFGGGDSIAANAAEQTVDPWPRGSNNNHLAFNGQRMQRAVECYRYNKVAAPVDMDPSNDSPSLVPPPQPVTCDTFLSGNNNNQWNNQQGSSVGIGSGVGNALSNALGGGASANSGSSNGGSK